MVAGSAPRSRPLLNVEDLLGWSPDHDADNRFCIGHVPLPKVRLRPSAVPRLLVCHDMAGGYHDDAWAQGCESRDPFYISHWHLIDTFVYFSHSFVTMPPPGCINSAHRHDVEVKEHLFSAEACLAYQVLGTLITEWNDGRRKCEEFLQTEQTAKQAARQLAAIAAYFGFDGWLLNFENELDTSFMPNLLLFIRTLRAALQQQCSRSQVIWYDAVTAEGKLTWQNTLNCLNRPFFDACDAIFVNYAWKAETPAIAAREAGERRREVYMGIDVFGRGTYAGGQLNSYVAAAAALEEGLSVALFAPGWVYEGGGPAGSAWRQRDQELWDSLAAVLPAPRPAITQLPFASDFNAGYGAALFSQGRALSTGPHCNLSLQARQPLFQMASRVAVRIRSSAAGGKAAIRVSHVEASICTDFAYQGLSCLNLQGRVAKDCPISLDLFAADVELPAQLFLETAVRQTGQEQLYIALSDASSGSSLLIDLPSQKAQTPAESWRLHQASTDGLSRLTSIGITCSSGSADVAVINSQIGAIRLVPADDVQPPPHVAGLGCSDVQWRSLSSADRTGRQTTFPLREAEKSHVEAFDGPLAVRDGHPDEASAYDSAGSSHGRHVPAKQVLSCTLTWTRCSTTEMYHIYYQGGREKPSMSARWIYLGSTGLSTFRAVNMPLTGEENFVRIGVTATSDTINWDIHNQATITVHVRS